MGRRGRRNRDDGDDDDQFEREYIRKRFKTNTSGSDVQQKSAMVNENNKDKAVADKNSPKEEVVVKKTKTNKETQQPASSTTSSSNCNQSDDQNKERTRLKNQLRKQRRKEKKTAAAKAKKDMENNRQKEAAKLENTKAARQRDREKLRKPAREFVTCRKGVKYADINVGQGPVVQDRKKMRVKYTLRAETRQGKIIDSGSNFGFRLGKGEVIEGWDIGVKGMRQGGTRHLIVPPAAGYGNKNIGAGSGAILYFEITLLSC